MAFRIGVREVVLCFFSFLWKKSLFFIHIIKYKIPNFAQEWFGAQVVACD